MFKMQRILRSGWRREIGLFNNPGHSTGTSECSNDETETKIESSDV
jgi:hypothetical protein